MNSQFTFINLRKIINVFLVNTTILGVFFSISSFTNNLDLNKSSISSTSVNRDFDRQSEDPSNSPEKVYDKWIFKSHNEGVDIFYKWFETEKYMIIKFDNTTSNTTVISFKPMVKCTNDLSSGNQTGKHVFLLPKRGLQLYIDFDCAGSIDADVIMDKLKVIRRP